MEGYHGTNFKTPFLELRGGFFFELGIITMDDNFVLIATNVTSIYLILKSKFTSRFPNKESLLATAGIINAMRYIEAGEIEVAQIIAIAKSSIDNQEESNLEKEIYKLSFFIRSLEVEYFAIDTILDYYEIKELVSLKFPTIRKTVEKVFLEYQKDKKFNPLWEVPANSFMSMNRFTDLRILIGIGNDKII